MNNLWSDVVLALRRLRKSPGFTLTALLTLALGIGATTAIFTLTYQVLLRPLPVAHPEQLYKVGRGLECCVDSGLADDWKIFSYDLYKTLREQTPGTAGIVAVQAGATTTSVRRADQAGSGTQAMDVRFVSGNYFAVLQPGLSQGRALTEQDDREGADPVAVIAYWLWQTKFAADPHLVGSTLLLSGHAVTVVGIGKQGFYGDRNDKSPAGIFMALAQEPLLEPTRTLMRYPQDNWLDLLVRVEDKGRLPQIQLALKTELRQWIAAHADLFTEGWSAKEFARQTTELAPAASGINNLAQSYASSLHLLLLVAAFVLLIACANLANLLLVRGMARRQEIAVRNALGAPRGRVVREMLVEAMVLALGGGVLALLLSYVATRAIIALAMPGTGMNPVSATPSLAVIGFAFAVAWGTGLLFGTVPAWLASRSNPVEALRGANRSTRESGALPQKILVVLQAALSLALLSTAGLLITSLNKLEQQNFHFARENRLLLYTDLEAAGYKVGQLPGLYARFDDVLGHLPGVEGLAYGTYTPQVGNNWDTGVWLPGAARGGSPGSSYAAVNKDYFQTLGIHGRDGRMFNDGDTATSPHVAVINQQFADTYFKGKRAVGERFGTGSQQAAEYEVVGVVENAQFTDADKASPPMFFTPLTQTTVMTNKNAIADEEAKHYAANLVFSYRGDEKAMAAEARQALNKIDPQIPILRMTSYGEQMSSNFSQDELVARLTTLFGALALVLATIGLYGVTAYTVARRTGEIGIRMALGATRTDVLAMIVRGAVWQVALGLVIGVPVTYALARVVKSSLYETSAFQPFEMLAVIGLLLVFALAAALLPARRAASIEPMQALRNS